MNTPEAIARQLAGSFAGGRWVLDDLVRRGARVLGRDYAWLHRLAVRLLDAFPGDVRPGLRQVTQYLLRDAGLRRACRRQALRLRLAFDERPEMFPTAGPPRSWRVPTIVTAAELAAWLGVTLRHLDWFAQWPGSERREPEERLRHYHYRWLAKRGGGSARLLEAPKWRLKTIQRKILHGILDAIAPHNAAHGFRRHRSVQSYVDPHLGQAVVIHTDLRDFFPSVSRGRIHGIFRTAGYPDDVAAILAALCTNRVPDDMWGAFPQYGTIEDRWYHQRLYQQAHLPQGAPTSPTLANLVAFRLDARLSGLAAAADAHYTRYADDLLFSGNRDFAARAGRFLTHVYAIIMDEGFSVNARKTRIMRPSVRQAAAGLTINRHANIPRDEYDRLKATLHNCVTRGPAGQNLTGRPQFRCHLDGRVAHVESVNPQRGMRLRILFQQIDW